MLAPWLPARVFKFKDFTCLSNISPAAYRIS